MSTLIGTTKLLLCSLIFASPPAVHPKKPYFTGLGHLPGGTFSIPASVADERTVVVGISNTFGGSLAFSWTPRTGMVSLGDLFGAIGNPSSSATSVSARGLLVVGWSRSPDFYPTTEAFVWTPKDGMRGLGSLPGGSPGSNARGVSSDGSTIVGKARIATGVAVPFRWTEREGMIALVDPGGALVGGTATAVSGDGSVIVGNIGSLAFVWSEETGLELLGDLPGGSIRSAALAVSEDGTVVVGSGTTAFGTKAAYWTEETGLVPLPDIGRGFQSEALAVSSDGSIIVGYAFDYYPYFHHAVIWRDLQTVEVLEAVLTEDYGLELSGWTLVEANGISADGTNIVGYGRNPEGDYGNTEAWLVQLPRMKRQPIAGSRE